MADVLLVAAGSVPTRPEVDLVPHGCSWCPFGRRVWQSAIGRSDDGAGAVRTSARWRSAKTARAFTAERQDAYRELTTASMPHAPAVGHIDLLNEAEPAPIVVSFLHSS